MRLAKLPLALVLVAFPGLLGALDLETVLEAVEKTALVQAAEIGVNESRGRVEESRYPGDISVSAQPGVSVQTPTEGPFAEVIDLSGSLSFSMPVGLSDAKTAILDEAVRAVDQSIRTVSFAKEQAYLDLYTLYQDVWIAQEARGSLSGVVDAARATYERERLLFESGAVSLLDYSAAEDALKQAEEAVVKGNLEHRLAWVELASIIGIDWRAPLTLEPALGALGTLPRASELITWSETNHPDIITQQERVDAIVREIEGLEAYELSATIRTTLSAFSHNVAVGYNTASPSVTASYSFPIATIGPDTSTPSSGSSSWSIGLSASIGVVAGRESELAREKLLISLESTFQRLESVRESISIQIRSKYQQYLIAAESVEAGIRAVDRAETSYELAQTRYELKQLTVSELGEARIQIDRAALLLNTARVSELRTALAAAHAAAYLNIYIGNEE